MRLDGAPRSRVVHMLLGGTLSNTPVSAQEVLLRAAGERAARGDASRRSAGHARITIEQGVVSPEQKKENPGSRARTAGSPEQGYLERMRQRFPGGEKMLARDLLASLIREMSGEVDADARGMYVDRYL